MDNNGLEDIKALKERAKKQRESINLTAEEQEELRKNVQKIIERREEKERKLRRAEMERLYESGLFA